MTETVLTQHKQKLLRKGGKNTQNYTKKILMTQITPWMLMTQIAHLVRHHGMQNQVGFRKHPYKQN